MPVKNSNYTIGIRSRDLPVCTAVPQPNASPRTPDVIGVINITMYPLWLARCWQVPDTPPLTELHVQNTHDKRFLSTKDLSPVPCVDASCIGRRCIWGRGTDYLGDFRGCAQPLPVNVAIMPSNTPQPLPTIFCLQSIIHHCPNI